MSYPIILLTKERPLQLRDMVKSIEDVTESPNIIICDNASTQPEMVQLLGHLEKTYKIFRNQANIGFEGFNPALAEIKDDFFLLSDPDIILNPKTPRNWQEIMANALKVVPTPKIGIALDVSVLPDDVFGARIRSCESGMWDKPVPIAIDGHLAYWASVDTTMALYRRDTYRFWDGKTLRFGPGCGIVGVHLTQDEYNPKYQLPVIRMSGDFIATHTGWDMTEKYASDRAYYKNHCNLILASTQKWIEEHG